jgi:hypothetical protein
MVLGRIMAFRLMMIATRLMRMKRVWMKRCAYCLVVNEIIGLLISFG